ncbi:hypothetical protein D3C76_1743100 [compost metagenome]
MPSVRTVFRSKLRARGRFGFLPQITDHFVRRAGFAAPVLHLQLSQLIDDRFHLRSESAIGLLVRKIQIMQDKGTIHIERQKNHLKMLDLLRF